MGFFSGIGHALGSVASSVGDFLGKHGDDLFSWGSLASDVMGVKSANQTNVGLFNSANSFNARQAAINRQFQANMANTQYRRAVADLKAAGLNPMLAYTNGGAAAPSGSSASSVASPRVAPEYSAKAAVSAAQTKLFEAQVANIDSQTALNIATAVAKVPELKANLIGSQAYQAQTQGNVNSQLEDRVLAEIKKIKADTSLSHASASQVKSQNLAIKQLMKDHPDLAGILQVITKLL